MSFIRRALIPATALTAALGLSACGGSSEATNADGWPDPFVVAVIPSEDQMDLDPSKSPTIKRLAEEFDLNVEFHTATSYSAVIEAQRAGKAHMAEYGPFSYMLAKDSGVEIEPLVAPAESADAQGGYHSVASVRADSDITDLKGAKGKTVCFVDPASTSGHLFPTAGLMEAGLDPKKDITPMFAGGHDASVLALKDGQCDIAFSTEKMATKELIQKGQIKDGELKQIWKSESIPSDPVAISTDIPEDKRKAIADFYVKDLNVDAIKKDGSCDTSDGEEFCGLGNWGFVKVKDSDYDGIRSVCDTTKAEACSATDG